MKLKSNSDKATHCFRSFCISSLTSLEPWHALANWRCSSC